jgi:AsmA protein
MLMQKRWVRIVIAVVVLFLLVVVLVPFLVNADTFRPTLQAQLGRNMGRSVTFGRLSFSLLKGSLVAEDIAIADDPAFSNEPFLRAKSLSIGVQIAPLLFHRQLRITSFTIDTPSIRLLHAADGRWNFSSIGGPAAAQTPSQESVFPDLTVGELTIKNGSATIASLPSTGRQFVYSGIKLSVQQLSFLKSFPFELSADLPASGSFELKGEAGPLDQKDASNTPFHAALTLKKFDPVAAGVLDASSGMAAVIDIDSQLASDGTTLSSGGTIHASQLKLARSGSPASKPVDIRYAVSNNLENRTGRVSDLSVQTGAVATRITGGFRHTGQGVVLDLHLAAPNLPVDALEDLLPTVGVRLPTGSRLTGGTLTASLAITGPATAPVIAGPVEIDNSKLAGFNLGTEIQGLSAIGSKGTGTDIQTIRATLRSSPQATAFSDIYGNLPQIGTATGDGTVSPTGALNFKMNAKLNSSNAVGSLANQAVDTISRFGGLFRSKSAAPKPANNGIPLTITGTTSNPTIRANIGAMLR